MADLPDTEPSAVGRNAEFNEFVKCVIIVIKIKFNGLRCLHCRVTDCVGCLNCVGCRGCRVTEHCVGCLNCVGCLHCVVIGIGISI